MKTDEIRRRLAALAYAPTRTHRGDKDRRRQQALIAQVRTLERLLRNDSETPAA